MHRNVAFALTSLMLCATFGGKPARAEDAPRHRVLLELFGSQG